MESIDICGVRVSAVNLTSACDVVCGWIKHVVKTYVCVVPVATIVECQSDKSYLEVINHAGMATPDGMPLVWLGKWRGCKNIERTYGPDLMQKLCDISQEKGYRHYFYGATADVCKKLEVSLKEKFPKLRIAGTFAPPFRKLTEDELKGVVAEINTACPDILWVGLGSPKQDFWMHELRAQLNVPVMIGVGAAFDFLSGVKRQAPRWMQRTGLEWFFRFCQEPARLWRRYLIGNTKFIYFLARSAIMKTKVSHEN